MDSFDHAAEGHTTPVEKEQNILMELAFVEPAFTELAYPRDCIKWRRTIAYRRSKVKKSGDEGQPPPIIVSTARGATVF